MPDEDGVGDSDNYCDRFRDNPRAQAVRAIRQTRKAAAAVRAASDFEAIEANFRRYGVGEIDPRDANIREDYEDR